MYFTVHASKKCISLCNMAFGESHHLNNRANAIRHGLWNILIIKRLIQAKIGFETAKAWSKKITDWHERFSVNSPVACAMDLHNNAIGRNLYKQIGDNNELEILNYLKTKAQKAICVTSLQEIHPGVVEFVFLNE